MTQTDCEKCTIEQDLFIRLCPIHKAAPELLEAIEGFLDICQHRWRALPANTPEKKLIHKAIKAVAKYKTGA